MRATIGQACGAPGLALVLAMVGAPMASAQNAAATERGASADMRALTDAYNASASNLFKELSGTRGNIILSPYSIGTAMAMVLDGARGETAQEMTGVLRQRLDRAAMGSANAAVQLLLRGYDKSATVPRCPAGMSANGEHCEAPLNPEGQCAFPARRNGDRCVASGNLPASAKLMVADALMLTRPETPIAPDYVAVLEDQYAAELFRDASLDDVNRWVARNTQGKIERILDRIDSTNAAVILNAVYFQSKWAAVFAKSATADGAFHLNRRTKIAVPMMRRTGNYTIAERPGYRALRLPYEIGSLGMIIVLPNEIDGLDAVSRRLDAPEWTQLASALQAPVAEALVDVALPKFKTSFEVDLAPLFKKAGMEQAFDPHNADFSGMTGLSKAQMQDQHAQMAIGSIVHRAMVDVMEDGTEAAAATAVTMVVASVRRPEEPQPFHVDRPFLFAILDQASGAILFQGRVVDPR